MLSVLEPRQMFKWTSLFHHQKKIFFNWKTQEFGSLFYEILRLELQRNGDDSRQTRIHVLFYEVFDVTVAIVSCSVDKKSPHLVYGETIITISKMTNRWKSIREMRLVRMHNQVLQLHEKMKSKVWKYRQFM